MLKRREESSTYLTHVCRHCCSGESPEKRWNVRSFHSTLWLSSAVDVDIYSWWKPQCWAENSILYFIFSLGYLCYEDVYRQESGRWCSLHFFLTFLLSFSLTQCLLTSAQCDSFYVGESKNSLFFRINKWPPVLLPVTIHTKSLDRYSLSIDLVIRSENDLIRKYCGQSPELSLSVRNSWVCSWKVLEFKQILWWCVSVN